VEPQFTERIIRLPHNRFCYVAPPFAPPVQPPPTAHRGYITFGSFNNTAKLNESVIDVWARILCNVPDSRLVLKWRTFADPTYSARIRDLFQQRGVDSARLDLRPMSVHRELLEQYADIDIALDPFPFSGGHTSCEALWMGVPIVTFPQERVVSRQTFSFLANIDLTDLAARDADDYVRIAVALANDQPRLARLRETLRPRLAASALCNPVDFTRSLEDAYHLAWNTVRQESALACAMQGMRLRADGADPALRVAAYREAVRLAPEEGVHAANLASALCDMQAFELAEAYARRAAASRPERFESWFNLGLALVGQQRNEEAAAAFERAADIAGGPQASPAEPDSPAAIAYSSAGDAWARARNPFKAAHAYQAALRATGTEPGPRRADLLTAFGEMLEGLYQAAEAEVAYREANDIRPDDVVVLTGLGNALRSQKRFDEARVFYERVLEMRPELPAPYTNLGTLFQAMGENDRALEWHRRAIEIDPSLVPVWTNLAAAMTYSLGQGPQQLRELLRDFDRHVGLPLRDPRPWLVDTTPDRRLRVGYVSPDFRKHAVAYFAAPLLEAHDHDAVEVFCYYNHLQNDEWTERFRNCADHFRSVVTMSDEALAEQIRADQIDVLVDLAGHTEGNRLTMFARKPAPVQVTWMGYVTSTGLSAMDWRVTHADADPPGTESHYVERLWRLPGTMWCYQPLNDMPQVAPPPVLRKGHVTFGSFNRYSKTNALVLGAWAEILAQVPDSRLVLCIPEGKVRDELVRVLSERGVDPGRVQCFVKVGHADFWALHAEVDIALDPFPFGGGTTTCETLWMGVPLVTCTGREGGDFEPRFASRMSAAFLRNIGLPELATETVDNYVALAVSLANDISLLTRLRSELRPRMAAAPLTDANRFAREMEAAYRGMWGERA
jgi:predicted O-linked N-acetylglucosamine transferase (SPINDLY family)